MLGVLFSCEWNYSKEINICFDATLITFSKIIQYIHLTSYFKFSVSYVLNTWKLKFFIDGSLSVWRLISVIQNKLSSLRLYTQYTIKGIIKWDKTWKETFMSKKIIILLVAIKTSLDSIFIYFYCVETIANIS